MEDLGADADASVDVPFVDDVDDGTIKLSDLMAPKDDVADVVVDDLRDELSDLVDPIDDAAAEISNELDDFIQDTVPLAIPGPVIVTEIDEKAAEDLSALIADGTDAVTDEVADVADALNDMDIFDVPVTPIDDLEDPMADVADIDASDVFDPISELAAQIQDGNATDEDVSEVAEGNSETGSLFVEEGRVIAIEDDVTKLGLGLADLTSEISQMNALILQSMERSSVISERVESNERSLRGVSAILTEFAKVRDSLDQTQIVLLDIAARVGTLEASNPADRNEVSDALREIDGEMKRLTANMAILARMTVNGVTALQAEGASAGNFAVQTSPATVPAAGNDVVYADQTSSTQVEAAPIETTQSGVVSPDVAEGDFVEGYGYVLDIVPASGNQNLVVMENGSVLVPK